MFFGHLLVSSVWCTDFGKLVHLRCFSHVVSK